MGVVVGAEPGLGLARERKNLILSFTPPLSIRWALEYLLDYNTFTNVVAVCPVTYYLVVEISLEVLCRRCIRA